MCDLLGRPELAEDPRFATNADRLAHRESLSAIVQEIVADEDGHALCARLLAAGLPAGPVLYVDEVVAAPHTAARRMVAEIGWYRALDTPIKFSRTPGGARTAPPRFGEHGEGVLAAHGFSAGEIAALKAAGVVVTQRRGPLQPSPPQRRPSSPVRGRSAAQAVRRSSIGAGSWAAASASASARRRR
ncbi:MAG: CoA transferase [Acetobacteraceae bacterium]|nr:CoA transferase [Acetobacteraceae bacterium]